MVSKYKIMFAKTGMSRFTSHLDLSKLFERALRRADIPIAFSQGFNPHPKMSVAVPLAVGVAGERELLEVELKEEMEPQEITRRLNEKLPAGVKVLNVKKTEKQKKSLMAMVQQADYRLECMVTEDLEQSEVEQVVSDLLKCSSIVVQRKTKGKVKESDIRSGIHFLEGKVDSGVVTFNARLNTGSGGNVRPEEILIQLKEAGLPIDCTCCRIYRGDLYGDESTTDSLW